jgi:arabinogalactan oligomer/maltooligosaccharide transport system permease protein
MSTTAAPRVATGARTRTWRAGGGVGLWATRVFLIVLCVLVILPGYWVVMASVSPGTSAFSSGLIPDAFVLTNYRKIWDAGFPIWLKNSLIICTSAGLISLTINTLGAYAFSRLKFRGRRRGLMFLFILQMFPTIMALVAIYTLLLDLGLLDTLLGVIMVFIGGSAFNMWLIKNYFDSLPRDLDEAATMDGATPLQIFWQILLPLMRPMLATMFIFGFTGSYNDFIFSSIILQSPDNYTITVGLYNQVNGQYSTNWTLFSAGAVLGSLPILIVYMTLQRQLTSGLAAGAVKG